MHPNGKIMHPCSLAHAFRRLAEQAGLREPGKPGVRLHDLRHTYASLLFDEGVPLHMVQEAMGHSVPSTTAGIYGHKMSRAGREAARKLSERLKRTVGAPPPESDVSRL